ncbi:spore germination protein YndE [Peptococcaceae bacterium CEB3]|nr:spore germination protein YndE [Peptococcaceae bacterium CEB3]
MSEQEVISDRQYVYLFFIIVVATIVLFVPQVLTKEAGRSAWLVPLLIPLIAGLGSFAIALKLSQRFPGMALPQYSEVILGKMLGKAIGIAYLFYLVSGTVVIIREYTDFINITMLPNTPRLALILMAVVLGSYAATKRIEVIARAAQFVLPLFLGFSVFILLLSIPDMHPDNLLPLFDGGFSPIVRGSIVPAYWFGEIGFVVLFLPVVNKPRQLWSKASFTMVLVALFIVWETASTIMVFGAAVTKSRLFPFWSLSTYVEFQNYIQRVESLLVITWLELIFLKIALFSYMALTVTVRIFEFKSLKRVQFFLAIIEILGSLLFFTNIVDLEKWTIGFLAPFGLTLEIVIPSLLFLVALLCKKAGPV